MRSCHLENLRQFLTYTKNVSATLGHCVCSYPQHALNLSQGVIQHRLETQNRNLRHQDEIMMLKTSFRGERKKQVFLPFCMPNDTGHYWRDLIEDITITGLESRTSLSCPFETKRGERSGVAGRLKHNENRL